MSDDAMSDVRAVLADLARALVIAAGILVFLALVAGVFFYVRARRRGTWRRRRLRAQAVNGAAGPARELARLRLRLDEESQAARRTVSAVTERGAAVGDLELLCGRLEGVARRLDEQLVALAETSSRTIEMLLPSLRAGVQEIEAVAADLSAAAASSIAAGADVDVARISAGISEHVELLSARVEVLRELSTH